MAQWEATVRPMHLQFVESSKRHADLIIPEGGLNTVALEVILAHVQAVVDRTVLQLDPGGADNRP